MTDMSITLVLLILGCAVGATTPSPTRRCLVTSPVWEGQGLQGLPGGRLVGWAKKTRADRLGDPST
ncbi:hypothetical protein PG991_011485 [Apiospora marii]|uniref:Uncharacterized protein n=1 Tax=Apiospora marii TaxID=335849 RepID=A0ABR1RE95_9PEZI